MLCCAMLPDFSCVAHEKTFVGGRLPKRIVFGNLEGAVRRGRSGKEQKWTDCVQSDTRAFGRAGDWKATASEAEVWIETVTEGGWRFMVTWRK